MLHKNSNRYFTSHPDVNEFWFTSDGQHFFNENDANGQAQNLKHRGESDVVNHVTRAELDAPAAEPVPAPAAEPTPAEKLAAAQKALLNAKDALALAEKNKAELPADASGVEKGKATKAVNIAAAAVGDAQVVVDELTEPTGN